MNFLRAALGIGLAVVCAQLPARAGQSNDPLILWHSLDPRVSRWISSGTSLKLKTEAYVEPEVALFERFPNEPWPDMVLVPSNLIGLKDEFHFSEVSPALLNQVDPRILKTVRARDGKLYGVPVTTGELIMLFRAPEAEPSKVGELSAKSVSIAWEQPYYFIPFLRAWGGIEETGRVALNQNGLKEGLRAYAELNSPPQAQSGCNQDCAFRLLLEGKSALSIADFSQVGNRERAGRRFEVDSLPEYRGRKLAPWVASYALVFPNLSLKGKHAERLKTFIGHMLSDRNQSRLYSELHKFPVTRTVIRSLRRDAREGDPTLTALLAAFDASDPMPNDRAMVSLWPVLRKILREYRRTENPEPGELVASAMRLFSAYQQRYEAHLKETRLR